MNKFFVNITIIISVIILIEGEVQNKIPHFEITTRKMNEKRFLNHFVQTKEIRRNEEFVGYNFGVAVLCPNSNLTGSSTTGTPTTGSSTNVSSTTGSSTTGSSTNGSSTTGLSTSRSSTVPSLDYSVCIPSTQNNSGVPDYQQDLVFNPFENNFFLVYIENEQNQTSLKGAFISDNGTIINNFYIMPYSVFPDPKSNPVVVFNTIDQQFLVALEYVEGGNYQIAGIVLDTNGSIVYNPYYISGYLPGNNQNPQISYQSQQNLYMVAYEYTEAGYNPNLVFQPLYNNGEPFNDLVEFQTSLSELNPSIVYNPDMGYYYVVWESNGFEAADYNIYGIALNESGFPYVREPILIVEAFENNIPLSEYNPQIVYCSTQKEYLIVFDIDLDGPEVGPSTLIAVTVNSELWNSSFTNDVILGESYSEMLNRNPSVTYISQSNEYLVAYEEINLSGESTIRSTTINASNLQITSDFQVSSNRTNEYFPVVALNSNSQEILVVWNHIEIADFDEIEILNNNSSGNSAVIVGAVIGSIVGIIVIIVAIVLFMKLKKKIPSRRSNFSKMEEDTEM